MGVFVIAECGSSHDNDLQKAYRLVEAAKECGANAAKFQFWSSPKKLAERRKLGPDAEAMYAKYQLPQGWLPLLKAHCDKVGVEFMCSVFMPQDCDLIASYCKRGKISAFESGDDELISCARARFEALVVSCNPGKPPPKVYDIDLLYCISKYPTALEDLKFDRNIWREGIYDGFSDHTANVLTGAAAVAAGARIVEAHIRLRDTAHSNPDYGHSLVADDISCDLQGQWGCDGHNCFGQYVSNIRTIEKML